MIVPTAANRRHAAGFTLLELMIAAAIVALLAGIAIPSYQQYVLRTQRAVARAALVDIAAKMEVEALKTRSYPTNFDFYLRRGSGDSALLGEVEIGIDRRGRFIAEGLSDPASIYSIRLTATARAFELVATAQHDQAADTRCSALVLTSTGMRSALPGNRPECWSR